MSSSIGDHFNISQLEKSKRKGVLWKCAFSAEKSVFLLIAAIWANLFEHLYSEKSAEPPSHRSLLNMLSCFRFHCAWAVVFHQGWKGTFSAIVKEHWLKSRLFRKVVFQFSSTFFHQSSRTVRGGGYCAYSTISPHHQTHRLNMELDLQNLFALLTSILNGWDPATPPFPPHKVGGRYWSAKRDDISL